MNYVIIGNGPAGVHAVEKIRELDTQSEIILISKENNQPYSRIMTPEYMTGVLCEEQLFYKGREFYDHYNVEVRLGCRVEKVFPEKYLLLLSTGEEIQYDKLLIASGSRPILPSWVDLRTEGVFILWDKSHSEAVKEYLPQVKKAVIIGGGLVGLHSARALVAAGVEVTLIEKMGRLMPLQLDQTASSMILQDVEEKGICVLLDTEVINLKTKESKICGVVTKDQEIPADMVLVSIGVKANLEMIDHTEIKRDKGLLTDHTMQTSIVDIYAAGDAAQAPSMLTGENEIKAIWPCAVQQGKVAGANMAGGNIRYEGSIALNSIHLFKLAVLSLGQIEVQEGIEEKILKYPSSGVYQKLLLQNGKLMGLIFAGDTQQAGILYHKLGQPVNQGYRAGIPAINVEEIAL